jgi:DNA-directed RNA polymerase subunit RPC12/RpoP
MGFFENLGRKVGKFTHEAKEAAAENAAYVCTDCGEEFYTEQERCPACDSEAVIEREPSEDDAASEDADETTGADTTDAPAESDADADSSAAKADSDANPADDDSPTSE